MENNHPQLNYYRLSPDEVLASLATSKNGLTSAEAANRLKQFGANTLHRTKPDSNLAIIVRQFKNLLVVMLLFSAGFSLYLQDYNTALILLFIALMNACVGYFQEHKAGSLMQQLEQLLVPQAKVLRNGTLTQIDSTELVVGDIVYVEAGDSLPADVRVLEEQELATNDFALTGESNPSRKFVHAISADVPLGSRHNLLFMGTTVATGSGHGVVVGTGMHSELGRIASLSQSTHTQASPLQKEMNHLATRLAQGTLVLASALILIALQAQLGLHAAILFGIGIGAAMIPNGLVAEVSITLAQSASRLAKQNALVKKLSAVETLGATNIILTDKTGTLTKNEMTVEELVIGKTLYAATGTGYEPKGQIVHSNGKLVSKKMLAELELFFATTALSSNARINAPDTEHPTWYVVGDPTEGALITLAEKAGVLPLELESAQPEIKEFQFDSARKLMSSVRTRGNQTIVYVKGAPEELLALSSDVWDHGHVRKLTKADRAFFADYNEQQAAKAKRNLAFGYRILPNSTNLKKPKMAEIEQDFTFLGMVSMVDPLRDAVPSAMKAAQNAHIKVSVITGDFPATAKAVAAKAGLGKEISVVLGDELPALSDSQILQMITAGGAVFSRVAPEDKLRIVEIAQRAGNVVAVTGDGINDAPALKRANIGVAMGVAGTDVAKEAAEVVLLDDSFHTLVSAVEQGRLTFQNIKKAARCALTDNAAELTTVMFGLLALSMFHIAPAITAIQILAIDIVAQILPITALGWDKAQGKLMHEKPRNLHDHIINKTAISGFIGFGALAGALAFINYLFFFVRNDISARYIDISSELPLYHQATTLTYLTLVLCLYVYLMFERSDAHEKFFTSYLWSNKKLLIAFGISFVLIFNIIYNPIVQPYFGTEGLGLMDWLTALLAVGIYTLVRLMQRHTRKHSRKAVLELHKQVHGARA